MFFGHRRKTLEVEVEAHASKKLRMINKWVYLRLVNWREVEVRIGTDKDFAGVGTLVGLFP